MLDLLLAAAAAASTPSPQLSMFVPDGPRTRWVRLDPRDPKHPTTVATFPGPPQGARAAWSADRTRQLVWFDPTQLETIHNREEDPLPGAKPRLYLVEDGHVTPLSAPTVGGVREAGFDAAGNPTVLTLAEVKLAEDRHGRSYVDFEGKRYTRDAGAEGTPVLVHAFRLDAAKKTWTRYETTMSSDGWDYAQGVMALSAYRSLGYRADASLEPHPEHDEVKAPATLAALKALAPTLHAQPDGDTWWLLKGPAAPVYCWSFSGEFTLATGRIAFGGKKPAWAPRLPWGDRDAVAINWRGPELLVCSSGSGGHPRLYDVVTRRLLFADDHARDVVFWPAPEKPKK